MQRRFSASLLQIRRGYEYFRHELMPDHLAFAQAANELVRDFGLDRVRTVLLAIPNDSALPDSVILAAAQAADPQVRTHQ